MPEQINNSSVTPYNVQKLRDDIENKTKAPSKNIRIVNKSNEGLDKKSFLKLLVTQLSYQDPMKPMNDREFISQMAQFSALEQMQNVSNSVDTLKAFQANDLVGKVITGNDMVHGSRVSGVVHKVTYDKNGNVFLSIPNYTIKLDDIQTIEEQGQTSQQIQQSVPPARPQNVESNETSEKVETAPNVSRETITEKPQTKNSNTELAEQYQNMAERFVRKKMQMNPADTGNKNE